MRILADGSLSRVDVEVATPTATSYSAMVLGSSASQHKLAPLFALLFRRSTVQHPLLAAALGEAGSAQADQRAVWNCRLLTSCQRSDCCQSSASCYTWPCPTPRLPPARLCDDPANLELLSKEELALRQLVASEHASRTAAPGGGGRCF